jgi:hypothetical protein
VGVAWAEIAGMTGLSGVTRYGVTLHLQLPNQIYNALISGT